MSALVQPTTFATLWRQSVQRAPDATFLLFERPDGRANSPAFVAVLLAATGTSGTTGATSPQPSAEPSSRAHGVHV